MTAGRPLTFNTAEELETEIKRYFDTIDDYNLAYNKNKAPTTAGLALHLGFASRQSLYDYKERDEFSYIIKRAILRIESFHEENLGESNTAGHIFWLKNHDWKDKSEVENNMVLRKVQIEFDDGDNQDTTEVQTSADGSLPQ